MVLLMFFSAGLYAVDTLHVVTHSKTTVVTNPTDGFNYYKSWGRFPSANVPVRQIIMKVRLGCPDGMRCADWDYKDHITIRRTGGKNGKSQDFEIGRMLTPYGGAFPKDWSFNWQVDVTDFSMLLRDSVEIEYNHTGWEPNKDRGWSVTIDFEIIKGTPALEPVSIHKIYDGAYRYGDKDNGIENGLKPVSFIGNEKADFARIRVVQTGHGMDRPDNCAEFCSKYREIYFDERMISKRYIWKHCGDNPLSPQAGTWVYDRANWCPGNLMNPDIYDVKVSGAKKHTVDINMQNYISSDPSADEYITAYVIQYKKPRARYDVRAEDIINPSLKDLHRRQNPSGFSPTVVIRNMGSETLRSLAIKYGTRGFKNKTYNWKGSLHSFQTDTISLPGLIDSRKGTNLFDVELSKPNGKTDQYAADNKVVSPFNSVPVHSQTMIVYLLTNNEPSQNSYRIVSSEGKVVQERKLGSLKANTLYKDTVQLSKGTYRFEVIDTAGNGLEFWANPKGGRGKLFLLNKEGAIIKDFESDFGSSLYYDFQTGSPADPVRAIKSYAVYPTRTEDKVTFDYYANFEKDVLVKIITDPGDRVVEEHSYKSIKEGVFAYDLSRLPKGRFYLKVYIDGKEEYTKRIRLKE